MLGRIPLDPQIASLCDRGVIELFEGDWLDEAADAVEAAKKLVYKNDGDVFDSFLDKAEGGEPNE